MRTAKSGPEVEVQPMNHASRRSFVRWVAMEDLAELVWQLGRPVWFESYPAQPYRLEPRDLAVLKAEVVARVKALGGRAEVAGVVITTEGDGLKVAIALPAAPAPRR